MSDHPKRFDGARRDLQTLFSSVSVEIQHLQLRQIDSPGIDVLGDGNALLQRQGGTPTCGELGIPEFFGRRLQTSMTRATVEDNTAGLGQALLTEGHLVGGLSFHGVSGMCHESLAHRLPGGIQAQSLL